MALVVGQRNGGWKIRGGGTLADVHPGGIVSPRQRARQLKIRLHRHACLAGVGLVMACGDYSSRSSAASSVAWLTEADYKLSGDPDRDVLFSQVRVLRADPYRDRVLVLDLQDRQLSAWTPEGSLVFARGGRGEGPGEFMLPTRLEFVDSGSFYVREEWGSRFTYYAADGMLAGTGPAVPTLMYEGWRLKLEAPTGDGGYLALPQIGSSSFVERGIDHYPLLRARRSDSGEWLAAEPIFSLNSRNREHPIKLGEDRTAWAGQASGIPT